MFDIDYFTYRKEPFTCLNSIGIHPLDDKGLEKYLSKDSYTHSYLRRTSPYIIESILKEEEEEDTENKKTQDKVSTLNQGSKSNKTKKNSVEKKAKNNFEDKNKNTLNSSKQNLNNTRTVTEGSSVDKVKLLNQKYKFKTNKNLASTNYYNTHKDNEHTKKTFRDNGLAVSMDRTNYNNRYKLKLKNTKNKLPLLMSQSNAKNTITWITGYSKEMGENYNPYAFISPSINRTKRNYVGGLYHC